MLSKYIKNITAVSEPAGAGFVCTAAIIEYDRKIKNDLLRPDCYEIQDRKILKVYGNTQAEKADKGLDGSFVILELDTADAAAGLYEVRGRGPTTRILIQKPKVRLRQVRPIQGEDGVIPAGKVELTSNQEINRVIDDFIPGVFQTLAYNLFIPRNYDETQVYPLVLFIHDAGCCGTDPRLTLVQGTGATVWASPEHQEKYPCFVLAPQFAPPPMVNDNFEADHRIEIVKRLLDFIVSKYSVDVSRIYTTGQSMGCMSSCELYVRYPGLFAAAMLVAGQWNPETMAGVPDSHMWIIVSEGDKKAFPGMTAMTAAMEDAGAKVVHETWSAKAAPEEWNDSARRMIATGANILFVSFDRETVAGGINSGPGEHHEATWQVAYEVEAIRQWLFTNHK